MNHLYLFGIGFFVGFTVASLLAWVLVNRALRHVWVLAA